MYIYTLWFISQRLGLGAVLRPNLWDRGPKRNLYYHTPLNTLSYVIVMDIGYKFEAFEI